MGSEVYTEAVGPELIRLTQMIGVAKAAELLRVSESFLHRILREEKCRPLVNLAAEKLLSDREKPKADRLYFVRVEPEREELFCTFLQGCGFKYRTFTD